MNMAFRITCVVALLSIAASFGFFYAWSVSAMWGLDATAPEAAIAAMNGVNSTVQNAAFAFSFFGAPLLLLLAMVLAFAVQQKGVGVFLLLALAACIVGVHAVTYRYHIPLNRQLLTETGPFAPGMAEEIWAAYSAQWKSWNWVRTLGSGLAVAMVGLALLILARPRVG